MPSRRTRSRRSITRRRTYRRSKFSRSKRTRRNRLNRIHRSLARATSKKVRVGKRSYRVYEGKSTGRRFIRIGGKSRLVS